MAHRSRPDDEKERGFTLIELLVVIIIIGVLASIAIPVFLNQRKKAADASVKADLRTTAMTYMTWFADGNTNLSFRAIGGGNGSVYVADPAATLSLGPGYKNWNDQPGFPIIKTSPANSVEFIVATVADANYTRVYDEGEFCLAARGNNSQWNYTPGSGIKTQWDKYLYYDVQQGGVRTMKELADAYKSGQTVSCENHVKNWITATGY